METYTIQMETALVVTKKLFQVLISRLGFTLSLGSDNGLAFMARVSQNLSKVLNVDWKIHCASRPQSWGQIERMNKTLKEILTKHVLETRKNWGNLLHFALLKATYTPYWEYITPFEIKSERPLSFLPKPRDAHRQKSLPFPLWVLYKPCNRPGWLFIRWGESMPLNIS